MKCPEAVDGVHERCCLHDLPVGDIHAPGQVCCWCGDIFASRHEERDGHGEYAPGAKRLSRSRPKRKAIRPRSLKAQRALPEWEAIKAEVRARSGGVCELSADRFGCRRPAVDPHHCFGRHKGVTAREVLDLCRRCHDDVQNPLYPVDAWEAVAETLRRLGFAAEAMKAIRKAAYARAKARLKADASRSRLSADGRAR